MFWVWAFQFLLTVIVPLVMHLLKALGIGFIVYQGITTGFNALVGYIKSSLGSGIPEIVSVLGLMGLDAAISIVLSAMMTRLILDGVDKVTGRQKKFVFRA